MLGRMDALRAGVLQGLLWAALAMVGAGAARAADPPDPGPCVPVPFNQQVDVGAVTALAREAPQRLLARIERMGIDVRRVPAAVPGRPVNPLLAGLPLADARLMQQADFQDTYEGRSVPRGDPCCGPERDTVLIRETASTYTLLHEVLHLMIVPTDGFVLRADLEQRFALAWRRLQLYQKRLYDDPWQLLDPRGVATSSMRSARSRRCCSIGCASVRVRRRSWKRSWPDASTRRAPTSMRRAASRGAATAPR
jgi:hypothetical protein